MSKKFISLTGEDTEIKGSFSYRLSEIADRRKRLDEGGIDCATILARIHRICDPDGKKSLARLRRSYSQI